MKDLHIKIRRDGTTASTFFGALGYYTIVDVTSKPGLSSNEVIFIFFIAGILAMFVKAATIVGNQKAWEEIVKPLLTGTILGLEGAYTTLSLIVLHKWYFNPDLSYLEPLFIILSLTMAAMETLRRLVDKLEYRND